MTCSGWCCRPVVNITDLQIYATLKFKFHNGITNMPWIHSCKVLIYDWVYLEPHKDCLTFSGYCCWLEMKVTDFKICVLYYDFMTYYVSFLFYFFGTSWMELFLSLLLDLILSICLFVYPSTALTGFFFHLEEAVTGIYVIPSHQP